MGRDGILGWDSEGNAEGLMSRNAEQLWKEQRAGACSHRAPDDDFFCLRYKVWYCSFTALAMP